MLGVSRDYNVFRNGPGPDDHRPLPSRKRGGKQVAQDPFGPASFRKQVRNTVRAQHQSTDRFPARGRPSGALSHFTRRTSGDRFRRGNTPIRCVPPGVSAWRLPQQNRRVTRPEIGPHDPAEQLRVPPARRRAPGESYFFAFRFGPIISAGFTLASKSSAVRSPRATTASFSVVPSWCAFLATLAALS